MLELTILHISLSLPDSKVDEEADDEVEVGDSPTEANVYLATLSMALFTFFILKKKEKNC